MSTAALNNELVAQAVRELVRRTNFPVAFGGLYEDGEVTVSSIIGTRTRSIEGLRVRPERGLGGRAMIELRPRMTRDYGTSSQITHDYDRFILGEGLRTLIAIPIVVGTHSRGVLYAGAWDDSPAEVRAAPALSVAESVATELRIHDEVARRLRVAHRAAPEIPTPLQEELRESFAELRSISAQVSDQSLRARLELLEKRLVSAACEHDASLEVRDSAASPVHLSPRELDVLACAGLGFTNAQIAEELGLRAGTVKAYLSAAMSKLDVSTRHAAVTQARRQGILP